MIPIDVDYSYSPHPVHLASNFKSPIGFQRIVFDEYFGGVTIFPIDDFEKINGYSNEYWGWGAEDDDVYRRVTVKGLTPCRKQGRYRSLQHDRFIPSFQYNQNINYLNISASFIETDGLSSLSYDIIESEKFEKYEKIVVNI